MDISFQTSFDNTAKQSPSKTIKYSSEELACKFTFYVLCVATATLAWLKDYLLRPTFLYNVQHSSSILYNHITGKKHCSDRVDIDIQYVK